MNRAFLILLILNPAFLFSQELPDHVKRTTFHFGGYVKTDVVSSWFQNGKLQENSFGRFIHIPSLIPVSDVSSYTTEFNARESRFNFDVLSELAGHKIDGFLELDFYSNADVKTGIVNSYVPRLRHVYVKWRGLLVGQTWSTFMILSIPDDLDFSGAPDGLVLVRQPIIRYETKSNWWFSIEKSKTYTMTYKDDLDTSWQISQVDQIPDFVIRKNFPGENGSFALAAIYRTLTAYDPEGKVKRTPGYGISAGAKIPLGKKGSDIRTVITSGTGLGRYVSFGFLPGATWQDNEMRSNAFINGHIAYNHYWSEKWASSFNAAGFRSFQDLKVTGPKANDISYSTSVNLKYYPAPELMFGIEAIHANRILMDGTQGTLNRIQFSVKYIFGYTNSEAVEKKGHD